MTCQLHTLGGGRLGVGPHTFGTAPIGNLGRELQEDEWYGAVSAAWDAGVRYFDTAPHYGLGLAECRLAEGLAGRPRDDFMISTKVGRRLVSATGPVYGLDTEGFAVPATHYRVRDYSRDGVLRSLEASLARLRLDRVDIVFVHDPDDYYAEALDGAFPALEELRSQGIICSYGAGMNQSAMLTEFVRHTDLDVVMLAGRYTLIEQDALDDLLPECERRRVAVIAAGVFNSGLLATDRPRHSATYNYSLASEEVRRRADRIADVCERHGATLPAAAAQFVLGHPAIATACLGARSASQVDRNAGLFEAPVPCGVWSELIDTGLLRPDAPVPN
ncbi:aldo/keto reductase [Phytoactinopolyspora endophytica]|uniref:aldo/keto reductase n=1 Tax=Phytoactinopolyspora endophytica TaxID=1642495 RepID=UPI00101B7105